MHVLEQLDGKEKLREVVSERRDDAELRFEELSGDLPKGNRGRGDKDPARCAFLGEPGDPRLVGSGSADPELEAVNRG